LGYDESKSANANLEIVNAKTFVFTTADDAFLKKLEENSSRKKRKSQNAELGDAKPFTKRRQPHS
jgi:hypothetical protein